MNGFIKKFSFIGLLAGCFLTSCTEEVVQELVVSSGSSEEITVNDVKIKVHPTFLKCGDEVIIEAEHLKDQAIPVVLSSESLGIEDSLQTPFIIKKKISVEGKHELRFEYGTDSFKIVTSVTINAY